ncbi:MAG: squalene/phytoene synthase family protein [Elusimicrobia bacterium]|nr:squalene/phytoene synthase family protein [Elusimicrobiota bacterium]
MKKNRDFHFCCESLGKVSRTFALNINKLKGNTRKAVTVGYLLFRIADTFEDSENLSEERKIKNLRGFIEVFKSGKSLRERIAAYRRLDLFFEKGTPEGELLERGEEVLRVYCELPEVYRRITDPLIAESVRGMISYQKRKMEAGEAIFQTENFADLEKYCYYVAGVVGKMLTRIFCLKRRIAPFRPKLEKHQVAFGVALQLTNIAKDFEKDLKRGWFYIPKTFANLEYLAENPEREKEKILRKLIPAIVPYFDKTVDYIRAVPVAEISVRLFCVIPFVLAYNTVKKICQRKGNKLSRAEVIEVLDKSDFFASSQSAMEEDYFKIRKDLRFD